MLDDEGTEIAKLAAAAKRGSVVAAAGCGKTEQIARATHIDTRRRLILTHTHAGVDALRRRLQTNRVPTAKFHVDTIAGWCLRYAASFPMRSGLSPVEPRTDEDWRRIYAAAATLVKTGAVNGVLPASYGGLFVDEYQDCSLAQHEIIGAIAERLPTCVFGDPLQAIFDFKGEQPVDWSTDVFPSFVKIGQLTTPWRWKKAGNDDLAKWLAEIRDILEAGGNIDLKTRPSCVKWESLPTDPRFRQPKVIAACQAAMTSAAGGDMVVIGDAVNLNSRALLAQKLAAVGFSNIEPVNCKTLLAAAKKIGEAASVERLDAILEFIGDCMTGAERADYQKAIVSRRTGGKLGTAKFGNLIGTGIAVSQGSDEALVDLLDGFHARTETRLYRREMFFAMRSALRLKNSRAGETLDNALWEVQNRLRHAGRQIGKRSIGSTLLVKGLEFDHAVIIRTEKMSRKDWYVALTRASRGITVLSESEIIVPAA